MLDERTNWKTAVPCSVTAGVAGFNGLPLMAVAPILTPLAANVPPGPNPVHTAVTSVPTGPDVGESVRAGVFNVNEPVAVLPSMSVKVNAEPEVIIGRATVPENEFVELIWLLLKARAEPDKE